MIAGLPRAHRSTSCRPVSGVANAGRVLRREPPAMPPENGPQIRPSGVARGLRWRNRAAVVLGLIGCTQMVGYITGSIALRGIGAASAASPLPRVFSDVDGLETFASEFILRYRDAGGTVTEALITPEL